MHESFIVKKINIKALIVFMLAKKYLLLQNLILRDSPNTAP